MILGKTSRFNHKSYLGTNACKANLSTRACSFPAFSNDVIASKKAVFRNTHFSLACCKGSWRALKDSSTRGRANTQQSWWIFGVDGDMPLSRSPWRNVITLGIRQRSGSSQWGSHHSRNSFHLRAYQAHLLDALAFISDFWTTTVGQNFMSRGQTELRIPNVSVYLR